MLAAAFTWLLVLELFALAALPLSYRVFSRMPDRGFTFAKPIGLLGVSYAVWIVGLSHTVPNSRWTVLFALLVVAFISWLAARGQFRDVLRFLKASAPALIAAELLFIAVFFGVMLLRASVSDIVHTEQPMDLMFLNSTVASPHYPPNDPWLAGARVSYYYFGYLMIGATAMATGAVTSVAYNLGLATAAAIGAIAAFGVTFNLVGLARGSRDARVLAGLTAAFLLLAASNLTGTLELARAAGAGGDAFWDFVGVEGLTASGASSTWRPDDPGWWWWRASRVIPGAIAEFPAFSFVLGDMHPHVMSIGFLLLAAGLAVQVYLQRGLLQGDAPQRHWPLVLVTVLGVGSLGAINLWDLPVGMALVGGAILLNAARNERRMQLGRSVAISKNVLVVGAAGGPQAGQDLLRARLYTFRNGAWRLSQFLEARGLGPDADFGASVAAADNVIAVGAPRASRTGVVYLYQPWEDGWAHHATLRPPETGAVRGFGHSVSAVHGSVAVAAREMVYVFREVLGEWSLEAALPLEADEYPNSVAVALDGDALAVGMPTNDGGAAHLYERAGGAWIRVTLEAGQVRMRRFGVSVSLRGDRLAIGAEGAVVTFHRTDYGWETDTVVRPPLPSDSFGGAVGLDGPYLVAGTLRNKGRAPNSGMAYVFERTREGWGLHAELRAEDTGADTMLGSAVAIDGDTVALGAPGGGQGGVYVFDRLLDKWSLAGKVGGRWRLARAAAAVTAFGAAGVVAVSPFLLNFESAVDGILPLRMIATRPFHLVLIWGVLGFLVVPMLLPLLRHIFRAGNWALVRFSVAVLAAFAPILFWLQPIYGPPVYIIIISLFALHQAGYRLPRADEALFAYNPRLTLIVGSVVVGGGLLWDGVTNSERGVNGELLALDRLLVALPMAAVIGLALYGAWTLAHRDSETLRQVGADRAGASQWNAFVPALLLLAVAGALVMGVELFHVSDVFGGELRRSNTVFKLYYQAWVLMAALGGFGLWYVGSRWDRRRLIGRLGVTAWAAVVVLGFGAVSYYPFAAVTARVADQGPLELDGLAYLERTAPGDYELIRWVRENTARDAVVLESSLAPCGSRPMGCDDWEPALGRVASSTGRPTVIGWAGHERQWRSDDTDIDKRQRDVRSIYETEDEAMAAALIREYGIDYIVLGPRERAVYESDGMTKFESLGSVVFEAPGDIKVYRIEAEDAV